VQNGSFRCRLEFAPLNLASGQYFVDVATSMVNIGWDHYVDSAVTFDVPYSNPGQGTWEFKQHYGFGHLALPVTNVVTSSLAELPDLLQSELLASGKS
jgi:lipopolysaccharide transport system ATP-binding protein